VTIDVLNTTGQVILTQSAETPGGKQAFDIDLSAFDNGIYFIRCSSISDNQYIVRTFKITLAR
ncbi:MAG TPA: T9SS type A sorting domain-containing protein, partial [Bacteroidia bacterium]|nr:T9SS type A sorting domain-containing protein [Bacteroidia bacterium]